MGPLFRIASRDRAADPRVELVDLLGRHVVEVARLKIVRRGRPEPPERALLGYKEEVGKSHAEDHCADALRYAIHTEASGATGSGRRTRVFPDIGF